MRHLALTPPVTGVAVSWRRRVWGPGYESAFCDKFPAVRRGARRSLLLRELAAARHLRRLLRGHPLSHAARFGGARQLAEGIQEHHHHGPILDRRLHREALARIVGEAGLLDVDVPVRPADEQVGVAK